MMKSIKYNPVIFKVLLALAVLSACTSVNGYCQYEYEQYEQKPGYSLLVQDSPAGAGFVTPESGVHRMGLNETVVLTAVAKPGYRFLYWLGDVDSPTANETTINLDSPKIVVAVFEREDFSLLTPSTMPQKSRGSGGSVASANRFTPKGGGGVSNPGVTEPGQVRPTQDLFPVPGVLFPLPGVGEEGEEDEDGLDKLTRDEPIPEPATIALLGFGAVTVLRRKRRR